MRALSRPDARARRSQARRSTARGCRSGRVRRRRRQGRRRAEGRAQVRRRSDVLPRAPVQRPQAPRHGRLAGVARTAGVDSRAPVPHASAVGSRRDRSISARRSRPDGARRHRAPRWRGDRGTRCVPRARRARAGERARLPGVAVAPAEGLRAMTLRRLAVLVLIGACVRSDAPRWRAECPPLARPAPLSLEAAREAHRLADRRQALRFREAAAPGSVLREMHAALDAKRIAAGDVCLSELADRGRLLFEHEYDFPDGLGGGQASTAPGGPFRRVHQGLFGGPETISCPSCHWVGGPNGAGAETDNVFLQGDGERTRSGDERNPPALIGLGVVQALAREMSRALHKERDFVVGEAGRASLAAMMSHLALLELPIVEPLIQNRQLPPAAQKLLPPTTTSFADDFQRGREQFRTLGCAGCHVPMLVLESPVVVVEGMPPIDLSREMRRPALTYDPALHGYPVWLFSDLKRHDMGTGNAAQHVQRGVALNEYLTPRLWGVADSAPYLHDGRAPSFDYAIAGHDGEGAAARAAFAALPMEEKGALRVYLMSLRRVPRVVVP